MNEQLQTDDDGVIDTSGDPTPNDPPIIQVRPCTLAALTTHPCSCQLENLLSPLARVGPELHGLC